MISKYEQIWSKVWTIMNKYQIWQTIALAIYLAIYLGSWHKWTDMIKSMNNYEQILSNMINCCSGNLKKVPEKGKRTNIQLKALCSLKNDPHRTGLCFVFVFERMMSIHTALAFVFAFAFVFVFERMMRSIYSVQICSIHTALVYRVGNAMKS